MGTTVKGEAYYRMKIRVGAGNWVDGERLYIKANGNITGYKLGVEVHSDTDESVNYQFYDILIDEALLKILAYSRTIKMRVSGGHQIDEELSFKRQ